MKSQIQRVEKRLNDCGEISRNECLKNYISRLSAIIYTLKKQGWVFTEFSRNGDYVYKVVVSPKERYEVEENYLKEQHLKLKYV